MILFGSLQKGTHTPQSDVDIAILYDYKKIPDAWALLDMQEDLSGQLHRDVDLICLNTADPIIGMQIYKSGDIILNNAKLELNLFFMTLVEKYIEIKTVRKPMEDNILKRKLYG